MLDGILVAGGEVLTDRGWTRADVLVREGRIQKVGSTSLRRPPFGSRIVDASGAKVVPGLIDLQVNGAFGRSFSEAGADGMVDVYRGLARLGVTGFLPALTSLPANRTIEALARIREAAEKSDGAAILGAHLEGPFLNPERAGAHNAENIRPPNLAEFTKLLTAGQGIAKLVTIAPEMRGAVSLIAAGVRRGVVMAMGHSSAGRAEIEEAIRVGATLVTHLFNAMSAFHHREENILSAALADDRLRCTCIYDRNHISRAAMQLALRCKPPGQLALVSDATLALEAPEGRLEAGGVGLVSRAGRVTTRETGKLAGTAVPVLQCVRNAAEDFELPLEKAWAMASEIPARILGLEKSKGRVAPEYDADLVVIDDRWHIRATLVQGRVVHGDRDQGQS